MGDGLTKCRAGLFAPIRCSIQVSFMYSFASDIALYTLFMAILRIIYTLQ